MNAFTHPYRLSPSLPFGFFVMDLVCDDSRCGRFLARRSQNSRRLSNLFVLLCTMKLSKVGISRCYPPENPAELGQMGDALRDTVTVPLDDAMLPLHSTY